MSEMNLNPWDVNHKIRAYDYVRKEWRDFSLMELSEEDWRKWVCWKLEQTQKKAELNSLINEKGAKYIVKALQDGQALAFNSLLSLLLIQMGKKPNFLEEQFQKFWEDKKESNKK